MKLSYFIQNFILKIKVMYFTLNALCAYIKKNLKNASSKEIQIYEEINDSELYDIKRIQIR